MSFSFKSPVPESQPRVWLFRAALAAILLVFCLIVLPLLPQKSMMVDDGIHIPAGYSYIETHDFRINQEHPPLLKMLSALGLTRVQPQLPLDSDAWQKAAEPGDPDDAADSFCEDFFQRNPEKYEQILFWGRAPVVIIPLLLALAVWFFTKDLLGDSAALFAVLLLLSEPNIIGNSTIVQDDLASALAAFVYVIALRRYINRPAVISAFALGITIGLALLIKHSLAALVPITALILIVHAIWRKLKYKEHLCRFLSLGILISACFYFLLLAGYAFDAGFIDDDEAAFISEWLNLSPNLSESFQSLLVHLPIVLPKYYLYGMDMVMNDVQQGRPAFLFGEVSDRGWWYYFPVAFVLKTSLPFLIATLAGLAWTAFQIVRRKWIDGLYVFLPPLLYLGMSMTSHLNIGVRHIMPVFPFFAVMGAGAFAAFIGSPRLRQWKLSLLVPALIIVWAVILVIITYPNYLTYFSPLAGGTSNGWKLLSDSNAETGQEVKNLAAFLKERGETKVNGLFMGSGYIGFYGIEECDLPCKDDEDDVDENEDSDTGQDNEADQADAAPETPDDKPPSYVAIGAWYLDEVDVTPEQKAAIDTFRSRTPQAVIGNSIFVFRADDHTERPPETTESGAQPNK